jgi:hypothetical protein
MIPVVFVQQHRRIFKRILRGNHQPDFLEFCAVYDVICNNEMAMVYRVKRTKI